MVLPFVKLGTLALRTACKPIANRLKTEAGKHPKFRQLIIDFAQANHRITTTMQRRIYGHATDVEIRPLNEEKAVQAAADILGEFFVFAVAGAAVIFEVQRSARSEARKEEIRRQELEAIRQNNEDLGRELEHLKQKLQELEQLAKGKGLSGLFSFRNGSSSGDVKSTANHSIETLKSTTAHSSENLKPTTAHSSEDAKSTIGPSSGGAKLAAPAH